MPRIRNGLEFKLFSFFLCMTPCVSCILSNRRCCDRVCTSFGIEEFSGGDEDTVNPEYPTDRGNCELVPLQDLTIEMFGNQTS